MKIDESREFKLTVEHGDAEWWSVHVEGPGLTGCASATTIELALAGAVAMVPPLIGIPRTAAAS